MHPIMHGEKKPDNRGVEGVRRTTARLRAESPVGAALPQPTGNVPPDPEVVARPTRRRFTAADKLRILQLADACTAVGSLGALLRAEGLYASNLTTWRRQRTEGTLSALTPQKRGRKVVAPHPLRAENESLRQENARLSARLTQAELIIEVQKKVSQILGLPLEPPVESGRS
jgi:transposase-like protein